MNYLKYSNILFHTVWKSQKKSHLIYYSSARFMSSSESFSLIFKHRYFCPNWCELVKSFKKDECDVLYSCLLLPFYIDSVFLFRDFLANFLRIFFMTHSWTKKTHTHATVISPSVFGSSWMKDINFHFWRGVWKMTKACDGVNHEYEKLRAVCMHTFSHPTWYFPK